MSPEAVQYMVENIQRQLDVAKAELSELAKGDDWPQDSEYYWYVQQTGSIVRTRWCCTTTDISRQEVGNVHRTEADAQAYANFHRALAFIMRAEPVIWPELIWRRHHTANDSDAFDDIFGAMNNAGVDPQWLLYEVKK